MDHNYALYYPTIEFQNYEWLWAAALIWDRIYKIVPEAYEPDEPRNIVELQEAGEIGIPLRPGSYAKQIAEEFSDKVEEHHWKAAALELNVPGKYARLHHEKVDVKIRQLIIAKGKAESKGDWLYVPEDFEALYMTYLANAMAEQNKLQLVSDSTTAWTGSTYFRHDGNIEDYPQDSFEAQLAMLVIRDFVPSNITDLTPKKILEFRKVHRDERSRFLGAINNAAKKISECSDPKVAKDLIEDLKKDIETAIIEYRKSASMLNVTGWNGIKSISFPILTNVIGTILGIDSESLKILSELGIAIGLVSGIKEVNQKQKKLSKESDYSYLVHLRRQWNNFASGNAYNYFLMRQMHEFIED